MLPDQMPHKRERVYLVDTRLMQTSRSFKRELECYPSCLPKRTPPLYFNPPYIPAEFASYYCRIEKFQEMMRNNSCRVSNTRIDRAGLVKGLVMMDKIDRAFGPGVGATQQLAAAELDDVATRYLSTKTLCLQVCVY
jgi:hypothetical protein